MVGRSTAAFARAVTRRSGAGPRPAPRRPWYGSRIPAAGPAAVADDGTELRPAYLACFAFREPGAAVDLILAALRRAGALGFRALRLCMTPGDLAALQSTLGPGVIEGTGAAIYTCDAPPAEWNLSASEV